MNVFDFAMQMELDSKAHYEKLASETSNTGLKNLLTILAANEMRHFDAMNALKRKEPAEMADSLALEDAKDVYESMRIDENLVSELNTTRDGFRHAMKLEEESIRFYEKIVREETEGNRPEVIPLLLKITEEEKKHYRLVEKIHDLIARFENFFAGSLEDA